MKRALLTLILAVILFGCSNEHSIDVKFSDTNNEILDFVFHRGDDQLDRTRYYVITNKPINEYLTATFLDIKGRELRKSEIGPSDLESKSKSYKFTNPAFQYILFTRNIDPRLVHKIIISKK